MQKCRFSLRPMYDLNIKIILSKLTASLSSQSVKTFHSRVGEKESFMKKIDDYEFSSFGYDIELGRNASKMRI